MGMFTPRDYGGMREARPAQFEAARPKDIKAPDPVEVRRILRGEDQVWAKPYRSETKAPRDRFERRLGFSILKAELWSCAAHVVGAVFGPAAGIAIHGAHAGLQALSTLKSLEGGRGLTCQIPVVTGGDLSFNIEMTLCENDPPALPRIRFGADFDDGILPSRAPTLNGADKTSKPAARHDLQPLPLTQHTNVVAEHLTRSKPDREVHIQRPDPGKKPLVTMYVQPKTGLGRIEVYRADGSPDTAATFKVSSRCRRCGRSADPGRDYGLRCEHCDQRSDRTTPAG
jgi:hypothetical protein